MKLSLCNEVLRELSFADQCRMAAQLGYEGLEVAPFTLASDPFSLSDTRVLEVRRIAEDHGLSITGLHWLLVAPDGLSITTDDATVRAKTLSLMVRLVEICRLMGGSVLVHGSPKQRLLTHAANPKAACANAVGIFTQIAAACENAGVTYCIEPLSAVQTDFVNTIEDGISLVTHINSPAFKTMLDTSSSAQQEPLDLAATIEKYWPTGHLAHVQVNDPNLRGPGQGELKFGPIIKALAKVGYNGVIAAEPFVYEPDGPTTAAASAGYMRAILEAI
ncbi:sugar phosphate isomerase/epimerase [Devosia rhodophyticola]|uniref:Sugar phosphate isomerase/epimerase n=1 Tax=Devosia rhodophyticola TaxID=3026423 RepID=A0ABY7YY73_9HYPH|nr:sugar phosphate isomerase/epimerase family protein [Devosia rhodophyticola]WDR06172.1 sugar phosphate isomerase/epimerase [Devosia rhodophyticola]